MPNTIDMPNITLETATFRNVQAVVDLACQTIEGEFIVYFNMETETLLFLDSLPGLSCPSTHTWCTMNANYSIEDRLDSIEALMYDYWDYRDGYNQ